MNGNVRCFTAELFARLAISVGAALAFGHLTSVRAWGEDWPFWRGPSRNGVVAESSGYDGGAWPRGEPAWRMELGAGSSSPLVVEGRLYTLSWKEGKERLHCLDAATGEFVWQREYEAPKYGRHAVGDQGIFSGPSSTPEFDATTGYLYTLGSDGELHCWDTRREGATVWQMNLYDRYLAPRRPKVGRSGRRDYGYTSSPLLFGDQLIVEVGAATGNLMAFDKRTGQSRWASQSTSPAGHNGGPTPITVDGLPCVAVHNFEGLLVARLDPGNEGQTLATVPWKTEFANNIATPAVWNNQVIMTSAYNHYRIARFEVTRQGARKVWERDLASKVCSPVIHKGSVYWAWRNVHCLNFETGETRWKGGRVADQGSCIVTDDDRLIVWANRGDLFLVDAFGRSPDAYRELAAKKQIFRRDAWPHVVLANGRLYCKDRDGNLVCFELQPKRERD